MTGQPKGRYCGSKYPHAPHDWRQIGRPEGPLFACKGKGSAAIQQAAAMFDAEADKAAKAMRARIRRRLATVPPISLYREPKP